MTITVVFDPPLPSDSPATFNTKAFATLGDLNDWSTEANALAAEINTGSGLASAINSATSKTTPVNADEIPIADSAATYGLKKLTWANLKATLASWIGGGTIAGSFTTLTSSGNATIGDAEATDTHTVKGATTVLANSANPAMKVTQTGAGNAFLVEDSASTDSTPFVIDASGRVILGNQTVINGSQLETHGVTDAFKFSADATGQSLRFFKSRGTAAAPWGTVVASGDNIASFDCYGADGTGPILAARIAAAVDGTPGTNDMPGRLTFSTTADGASVPTERMRIDASGNIGIGAAAGAGQNLVVNSVLTGATNAYAVFSLGAIQSDVTTSAVYFQANGSTQATSFTLTSLMYFGTYQAPFTGGSTVTNQYGFHANSALTGATNNYGFYGDIPSGAGRYNFYAAGTAQNAFNGDVLVIGPSAGLGYGTGAGGTVTQATSRTTGVTLSKPTGAITMFTAAGSATPSFFTVTNSAVAANDTVVLSMRSGATNYYILQVVSVYAGGFNIGFWTSGGTASDTPIINFAVIKATTS